MERIVEIGRELRADNMNKLPQTAIEVMNGLVGGDITRKTKARNIAWARFAVAHFLSGEGVSDTEIAEALNLARCSVINAVTRMSDILHSTLTIDRPMQDLYNTLKTILKDED